MKGSRVQAVVQELRGEKIDIVPYDRRSGALRVQRDRARPRSRASSSTPASHTMELIVPDDKLSLAIGKKGQNVRLASQLTGWRIDIHSESKVREMEARARQSLAAIKVRDATAAGPRRRPSRRCSRRAGARRPRWRRGKPDELAAIAGIGNVAAAQALIAAAAQGGRGRARAGRPRRPRAPPRKRRRWPRRQRQRQSAGRPHQG